MKLAFLNPFPAIIAKLSAMEIYGGRPAPKPMTVSQEGIQAQAERLLMRRGHIIAWDILMLGTTDCHKMLTRMRRKGLLYAADDANGYRWEDNGKGHSRHRDKRRAGRHKVHYWTRRVPLSWTDPARYITGERRKTARGGKA